MMVYLVPLVDADPIGYGRLWQGEVPADQAESILNNEQTLLYLDRAIELMKEHAGGKAVFTIHTSPYYRLTFCRGEYLGVWKRVLEMGGELAIHPHEDRLLGGSYFGDLAHMEQALQVTLGALEEAGIWITACRTGYMGFSTLMPALLQRYSLLTDLSAVPCVKSALHDIDWPGWFTSARFLDLRDYRKPAQRDSLSEVLSIPLGWDGRGLDYGQNYLFNERSDLGSLTRVLDSVIQRASEEQGDQYVNFLCHTFGMGQQHWREQCKHFLECAKSRGSILLTGSEARTIYKDSASPE